MRIVQKLQLITLIFFPNESSYFVTEISTIMCNIGKITLLKCSAPRADSGAKILVLMENGKKNQIG